MGMGQEKFDAFMAAMKVYAANKEWEGFSEESFLEDIIFLGGVALGEEKNAQGFRDTIDRLNGRDLFDRGNTPITNEQ